MGYYREYPPPRGYKPTVCPSRITKGVLNSGTKASIIWCKHGLKRQFLNNSLSGKNNSMLNAKGDTKSPIVALAGNLNIREKQGNDKFAQGGA